MRNNKYSYLYTLGILMVWVGLISLTYGCVSTERTKLQEEAAQVCTKHGGTPTKVDGEALIDCAFNFNN